MKWVLALPLVNEFGRGMLLFEGRSGDWVPFIRSVRYGSQEDVMHAGNDVAQALGKEVLLLTLEQAKKEEAVIIDSLVRGAIYGPCDHLDNTH